MNSYYRIRRESTRLRKLGLKANGEPCRSSLSADTIVEHHNDLCHGAESPDDITCMTMSEHSSLHNYLRLKNGTHYFLAKNKQALIGIFLLVFLYSCAFSPLKSPDLGTNSYNPSEMLIDTPWGDYTVILPPGVSDFYNNRRSKKTTKDYSAKIVILQGTIPGKCAHQLWVERDKPILYALVVLDCDAKTIRYWIYPFAGNNHSGEPEEVSINEFQLFIEIVNRTKKEV